MSKENHPEFKSSLEVFESDIKRYIDEKNKKLQQIIGQEEIGLFAFYNMQLELLGDEFYQKVLERLEELSEPVVLSIQEFNDRLLLMTIFSSFYINERVCVTLSPSVSEIKTLKGLECLYFALKEILQKGLVSFQLKEIVKKLQEQLDQIKLNESLYQVCTTQEANEKISFVQKTNYLKFPHDPELYLRKKKELENKKQELITKIKNLLDPEQRINSEAGESEEKLQISKNEFSEFIKSINKNSKTDD